MKDHVITTRNLTSWESDILYTLISGDLYIISVAICSYISRIIHKLNRRYIYDDGIIVILYNRAENQFIVRIYLNAFRHFVDYMMIEGSFFYNAEEDDEMAFHVGKDAENLHLVLKYPDEGAEFKNLFKKIYLDMNKEI